MKNFGLQVIFINIIAYNLNVVKRVTLVIKFAKTFMGFHHVL
jgi:hypothetical protein